MKYYVIVFTLGLLLGLFFSFMYRTLLIDPIKPPVSKRSVVELKKEVAQSEINYSKAFDSLKTKSTKLENVLAGTKKSLTEAKKKNQSLTIQVYALIDKQKVQVFDKIEDDTSCDSLITTVEYVMQSSSEKDSLYDVAVLNLEDQLKNKDSTLALKDEQYQNLKSSFDKSLSNQQLLLDENKLLGKQVKKQKFKSKVLSAVLFIFSGAAINHFIKH
jgi:hypothetical protein